KRSIIFRLLTSASLRLCERSSCLLFLCELCALCEMLSKFLLETVGRPAPSSSLGYSSQHEELAMDMPAFPLPKVISRSEWLTARKALLAKEKELTRLRD